MSMSEHGGPQPDHKLRRILALIRKESYQLIRDPSSIAIGIVMPVIFVLLFGYGLSLDVKNVPIAIVMQDTGSDATGLVASFQLSPYFDAVMAPSIPQAEHMMEFEKVKGIVRIRNDFSRNLHLGHAQVQLILHGTDSNTARIVEGYVQGAIAQWVAIRAAEGETIASAPVVVQSRLWFNEANDSHYFLVPGLIVLVMTLIGAFLTALVMAREWERGTFEALFATPVHADEILLGKTVPYFAMGMIGLALCVLASVFLFHVPLRGSMAILIGVSMLYLLISLGLGLAVSSVTKSQFVASQLALLLTFLPAMMLSGFLFDVRSMPTAVRLLTYIIPARYFVTLLQTIFLAGDIWSVILPNTAVLVAMVVALMLLARVATRKKLA